MSDYEEEFEELSVEEKRTIVKHFLMSSPPGQFQDVYGDVSKLVDTEVLPKDLVQGIARNYNLKNGRIVKAPSGAYTVVTPSAEVDAFNYVDPTNGSTFTLDHFTLATSESSAAPISDETLESQRANIQNAASEYVSTTYVAQQSAASAYSRDGRLSLVISGERTNLKNYWSGKWTSTWNIAISGSSAVVTGEIKIHVHYFEDGNLQMQTKKAIEASTLSFSSDADLASQLIAHIRSQETTIQGGLEELYSNMNNETLRSMRRVMTVTRTKMDWNVNSVRMVRQVRK